MLSQSSPSVNTHFPQVSLTPINPNLPPSYASLFILAKELNANAISVHSYRGDGKLYQLSLIITNAQHLLKSIIITFDTPTHLVAQATRATTGTRFQITVANRHHDARLKEFNTYNQIDNVFKRLIQFTIPDTYTDAVKDDDTGYGSVTTLTILTHLWDSYGEISDM